MRSLLLIFFCALGAAIPAFATATVQSQVRPDQVNLGDEAAVTYTVSNGQVQNFSLPAVDGITVLGSSTSARILMNGFSVTQNFSHTFLIVPNRAGNIIIPAFDLKDTSNGSTIRTSALTLHVVGAATSPASQMPVNPPGQNGPVVTPPDNANDINSNPVPDANGTTVPVPTDPDGQPARVFDVITPQTTTAYVGQSVPLRIESFIRADANAQQDSLPTLIGSDFLMNNLSLRPTEEGVNVGNIEYIRDSWLTAISAPRPGDFALTATRDTYWTKSAPPMPNDPFGPLFGRPAQLMHKDILSNKLVMHILPLPEQDKPAGFSGAIGKFQVSGNALPATVGVGEPVTLRFTITGTGNFDYVRSPALTADPAWKAYTASSRITYQDEAHTQAMKTFEQAIIPLKPGTLALPAATFSYFDPDSKRYVTMPVTLSPITVTGTAAPAVAADSTPDAAGAGATSTTASTSAKTTPADTFEPNRLSLGALSSDLTPVYQRPWFWIVQGILLMAIVAGIVLSLMGPRRDPVREQRALRQASLLRDETALDRALQAGDAMAFFGAARRVVQGQLAERWSVAPESLTLAEIGRRDPALAETVAPLFAEADDVIYSGAARGGLDLQEWNRRVREMLEPARA